MKSLISWLLGTVLSLAIIAAGPGVWWYDHDFHGYHFGGVPLVHWFAFTIPPGVGVRLASAKAEDKLWASDFATLDAAFTRENGAVLSLGASSAHWQAASEAATAKASRANAWRLALAAKIASTPEPVDQTELGLCKAAEAVLREGGQ